MKMVEGKSITTANKYEETVKCKKLKKKKNIKMNNGETFLR